MKCKIGLFFILFPGFAIAQSKAMSDSTARRVLNDFMNSWTLGIDSSNEMTDLNIYNKFKSFFDGNATIDDDFNVFYIYDSKKNSGTYQVKQESGPKIFDVYAHDVALQIKSIAIDSVVIVDSITAAGRSTTYTVSRRVRVQKTRQYVLPENYAEEVAKGRKIEFENRNDSLKALSGLKTAISKDPLAVYEFISVNTISITIAYGTDSARITNIKSIANKVVCTNDDDYDAVLNQEDGLAEKPGDFTANGKPDYDLDGVSDEVDKCRLSYGDFKNQGCPTSYFLTKYRANGFIGLQFNSVKINLPGLNQMGYVDDSGNNAVDVLQSHNGTLKTTGNVLAVHAGGNFTYYFGEKRKRSGISVGFSYTGITAEYRLDLNDSSIYTFKAFDGINPYRRQISISGMKEDIKYNVLNFPLMFNYRSHLNKKHKLVLNLQVGPSLMIFNATSYYNATIDFGGLYQFNPTTGRIVYEDHYVQNSPNNLFFTTNYINSRSPNAANEAFKALDSIYYSGSNHWDFASNRNYNGTQHIRRMALAANLNMDFQYTVSEDLEINFKPQVVYAFYFRPKTKYIPINRTTDEYQSIYHTNAKSNLSSYGINIGLVYNF